MKDNINKYLAQPVFFTAQHAKEFKQQFFRYDSTKAFGLIDFLAATVLEKPSVLSICWSLRNVSLRPSWKTLGVWFLAILHHATLKSTFVLV